MELPVIKPATANLRSSLGSSFFGRLLGSTAKKEDGQVLVIEKGALPELKFKLGAEPVTPRPGSPGFQEGHWVIARPKLATPTIYRHGRSPANEHDTLGLGATSRPSTRESLRTSSTRDQTLPTTTWSEGENCGGGLGGSTGAIHAWGGDDMEGSTTKEEGQHIAQQLPQQEQQQEQKQERSPERELARVVDNPHLDQFQPYVNDLYFATARPRFDADPTCLRRQRKNASIAAGAMTNTLGGLDHRTNMPPQPTDNVGKEHVDSLEFGARMLMRSLEGEFPFPMKTRAAAALQKVLVFKDVRERVTDVSPSAVAPLVELLRQEKASRKAEEAEWPSESGGAASQVQHKRRLKGGESTDQNAGKSKEPWKRPKKAPLNAAACLRILALSEGLAENMASASAIPALVGGLKSPSALMKSVCGGCLASMAPCNEEASSEMIDFGAMSPLLRLVRAGDPVGEVTGWSALAAIMCAPDARQAFARANGLVDLEAVLVKKRNKRSSSLFLAVCQESAMQILLRLCEETDNTDQDKRGGQDDGNWTIPTLPSTLRGTGSQFSTMEEGLGEGGGGNILIPSLDAPCFVCKKAVFDSVVRQMKSGTPASMVTAAEVLTRSWKACSREQVDATIPAVLDMLASDVWMLKSAATKVLLHVYLEDEQRLVCAVSGAVETLVDMLCIKTQQIQAGTLAALLSLCEHPDVPALVVNAGGLVVLAEYLTTTRDIATRYVVLSLMKIMLVCDRDAVQPCLPDMVISEHVLGGIDEVDDFVQAFVEKRKATDYLSVGVANLSRFSMENIAVYKETFKQLDGDASGALDEQELNQLLKQLNVKVKKKNVRKLFDTVDKNKSGTIEFDEFLDIMWDIKHAKGSAQGALLRVAGVFLGDTLAAAQAALTRQRKPTPTPSDEMLAIQSS